MTSINNIKYIINNIYKSKDLSEFVDFDNYRELCDQFQELIDIHFNLDIDYKDKKMNALKIIYNVITNYSEARVIVLNYNILNKIINNYDKVSFEEKQIYKNIVNIIKN